MRILWRETSVAAVLAMVLLGLAAFAPAFYEPIPLLSLLAREAPVLVVASGMALLIVARQIDISVGSQFAVCGVCAGLLLAAHFPPVVVLVICLLVGLALGSVNGLLVAGLQLPSIVVTLATMVTWREALRWQRQGQFVNLPPTVQWFGLSQTQGQILIVCAALGLLALLAWAAKFLAAGRYVYAVGSNAEAARLAGVPPRLITFALFAFQGGLCAAAAWLNTVQSPQVDPKSGSGLELKVIAAAVVGGVAITGGRGSLIGAALGLGLLICIGPALVYFRREPYWERAIQGAIILLAVMVDGLPVRARGPIADRTDDVRPA